ncbi:4-hydroxybenzoate 3-monooxygenase [Streptomyces sulphureus]|uniref:4-hydroxybenzoate 3-monooxygenase n=1 Tax=Streptomyces sulphureus TaxID=47758 RepID=UPI000368F4A4|nr:4-hydroxybenzoate 3-monooxygenase [Streptomyces sulphureus]
MAREIESRLAIIGAGPAGLTLANLLQQRGVPTVVLDKFSRAQILGRARAGLLEHRTVELLERHGLAERLHAEGAVHHGCEFRSDGESFFTDYSALYDDTPHYVYPQQEVVADLLDAYEAGGGTVHYETRAHRVTSLEHRPRVECENGLVVTADAVAGADGQHGAARASIPGEAFTEYTMQHEFRWLTLLARTRPSAEWTVYAQHPRGFAGHLLRSDDVTRFHLQVPFEDSVEDWPDERIWHELRHRLAKPGWTLHEGPVFSKNMLEMKSSVLEPMQYGRLFLLGDAAHIITPSGGKGMNLAIADAAELDGVLAGFLDGGEEQALARYSARRLPDIWKAQEFSHALIHMMHTYPADGPDAAFRQRLQQSRLWQLRHSTAYARNFAESYIGPPLGWPFEPGEEPGTPQSGRQTRGSVTAAP